MSTSRPDIMYSVCLCARFQADPRESHLKAVKRILRYLKGTPSLGLFYPKGTEWNILGYSDSDYEGSLTDRKSTSGTAYFMGSCLVAWGSKKQNCVAISTAESEYIAAASCCAQLLWLKQQANDFGIKSGTLPIMCDNTSAISISKNPVLHSRKKHIDIRHHFLKDCCEKELTVLKYICTEKQLADVFTKPLSKERFNKILSDLGMIFVS